MRRSLAPARAGVLAVSDTPCDHGDETGALRPSRLVAASLIDWTGTGFYLAISAILLTANATLRPARGRHVLAAAGPRRLVAQPAY